MKQSILLLSLVFILFGCHKHSSEENKSTTTLKFDVSMLKPGVETPTTKDNILFISEYADSISYIKLEAGKDCFIKTISHIDQYNNMVYVHDKDLNKIFVFDKNGHFKFHIGTPGRGPKEIIALSEYTIDKKNNLLYVWDIALRKILVFDASNGKYIEHFKMDGVCSSFISYGKDTFLVYGGHSLNKGINSNLEHEIFTVTKDYQIVDKYLPIKKTERGLSKWNVKFSTYNGLDLIVPTYSYHVYQIKKGECTSRYYLDFGIYNIPPDIYQKYNKEPDIEKARLEAFRKLGKEMRYKYVWFINNFFETDHFLGFNFSFYHQAFVVFHSKEKQFPIIYRNITIDSKDNYIPVFPFMFKTDRNCLVLYALPGMINKTKNRISSKSKFKKLFEESSELDNPTLFFVHLKNNSVANNNE